jgi:hypothetical protein
MFTVTIVRPQTHDEATEGGVSFGLGGADCSACYSGATRACGCGGRVHNERREVIVERCFSCGVAWKPV